MHDHCCYYLEGCELLMSESFSIFIRVQDFYSNNPNADKLTEVRGEIQAVKEVMVQNIGIFLCPFSFSFIYFYYSGFSCTMGYLFREGA